MAGTTVLAPISWGTTYVVVTELLPDGRPLLVAAVRVVPAGLALLALAAVPSRRRPPPRDHQRWWQTLVLALCNFGVFFPCWPWRCTGCPGEWPPRPAGCSRCSWPAGPSPPAVGGPGGGTWPWGSWLRPASGWS